MEEACCHCHYSTPFPLPRERLFLLRGWARLQAARDPQFCVGFNACLRELREVVAEYVRQFFRACGHAAAHGAGKTGGGPLGLSDGMQFSYAFDPQTITDEVTEAVLAAFFRRIVFEAKRQNKHAARRSAGGRATAVARRLD